MSLRLVAIAGGGKLIFGASIIAVLSGVLLLRSTLVYVPDLGREIAGRVPMQLVGRLLWLRTLDLGEILLNAPYAKLGRVHWLVHAAGIGTIILIAGGLWRAKRDFHPAHVYLLAYLCVMFAWPYGDNRFWLPVLPLLALAIVQAMEPLMAWRPVRGVVDLYAAVYFLMFLVAAVYTTRITFSRNFPEEYAGGESKADYIQAWSDQEPTTQTARMIRRYGTR